MIWRLAYPFLLLFGPVILPRLVRTAYAVWKLTTDRRVNILLRLLTPASLIYFLTPFFRFPLIGPAGYLIVLGAAVYLLLNLAPREVVEEYAPWRVRRNYERGGTAGHDGRVVEGSGRIIDEEEPPE